MSILVTRPAPQGIPLCGLLNEAGLHGIFFPSMEIKPIQGEDFSQLSRYDFAIFISQNAVHHSINSIKIASLPKTLQIIAMGPSTANTLKEQDIPVDFYPTETSNSDAVLALPILHNVQQKNILIIRGEGGKKTLAAELMKRGANVDHAIVYRRELPSIQNNALARIFNENTVDLIISTSEEGLRNLWALASRDEQTLLLDCRLLVISENMVTLAKTYGFKHPPVLTRNAQNETILKMILTGSPYESE